MESKKKLSVLARILKPIAFCVMFHYMDYEGTTKYLLVLLACFLLLFLGRKNLWNVDVCVCVALPISLYILIGGINGMFEGTYQITTIKQILYCLLPLLFAFTMYVFAEKNMKQFVDIEFWCCCVVYGISNWLYIYKWGGWESTYAFAFGVFVIYYAYEKKYINLFVALLFTHFADKRIALLGAIVVLGVMGIVWFFQNNKKLIYAGWGMITGLIFGYLMLIYTGALEAFCWAANINTNGRVEMYSRMASEAEFSIFYFGKGLGFVENLLSHWNVSVFSNLHNDLLKFYIELGFWGLLIYLLSYYVLFWFVEAKYDKSKMVFVFAMSIYAMLLFATDNVSIYMVYLIPFYSTIFSVLSSNRKKT